MIPMNARLHDRAYLLMHFTAGTALPILRRVGVYSEEQPTRMFGEFYAELARSEGPSFNDARLNLLQKVASDPTMAWLCTCLPEHDRAAFERFSEQHRNWVRMFTRQETTVGQHR